MASVHFDMLVPCGDMNQVREVLDMDKKVMNTVLGCFSDHGSECKYLIWVKVFKNGPSKICGRQPLKNLKSYYFKFFKGCLPQLLLGPFLKTLSSIYFKPALRFVSILPSILHLFLRNIQKRLNAVKHWLEMG